MRIVFTELANQEYRDIILWYRNISPELAELFITEFETKIELLPHNPQIGKLAKGQFRRIILKRFPYCIYYMPVRDEVIVYSIYHLYRKSPHWLTNR